MSRHISLNVDEELSRRFRIACMTDGRTQAAVLIEFMKDYIELKDYRPGKREGTKE